MPAAPVRYSPDVEKIAADEGKTIEGLNETFDKILTTVADNSGHAVRSVHAKAHGILEGTFTVEADLPPELAQGLFATPSEHRVYMRMSTNAGDILPDAISLPRGLAIKVLDVEGERLPDAEGTTQNFIMVNGKVFQAPNAEKFLGSLKLLAGTTDKVEGLKVAASTVLRGVNKVLHAVGIESPTIGGLGGAPNVDPLGETYYSVTPFRYGDDIAKFSAAPVAPTLTALTGAEIDTSVRPNAIRYKVQYEMVGISGEWEFQGSLCRDPEPYRCEDPTVVWQDNAAPRARCSTI
ncbi:catalase family protein, partial [Methylobacterium sp. J-067]|uniref:catalase family protein n=1 Tax=Methylobacterium sp. J-067 TaxID=2836648 RepID=UPI001FBB1132